MLRGGVLKFPTGEYHIKQTVLLSSGIRIEGVGSATIILLKGESAHFRVHSTRNVAVVNLVFKSDGNDAIYADQSKKSESDFGPKGLFISGVIFEDCGICLGYADTEDLTILNNHLQGTNAGIFLDGCKKALITGNTVSNRKSMHRGGISLVSHKSNSGTKECPVQNVIISNNIVHDCSESGIWIASGEYITVSGNHCF